MLAIAAPISDPVNRIAYPAGAAFLPPNRSLLMKCLPLFSVGLLLSVMVCRPLAAQTQTAEQLEFFEAKIRPVLVEQCYECHNSSETAEGGLALDHRQPMQKGGELGSLLDAAIPSNSLLLRVIRHEIEGVEMPEGGSKLAPSIIADFERWVKMGAPDPRDKPPSADELSKATSWEAIREKRKQWWSFQPIQKIEPPNIEAANPVDKFILHKLSAKGLLPSSIADRQTLLRRISFALTGLPPSQTEATHFLNDNSPGAFEKLVDRLLDSPQFGERWARHWMDWIRYAESHGSEGDPGIENVWMYRDYLIRALNNDVPYDQLVREHIAGDLLSAPRINDELQINESLIATAHWRMVFHGFAPTDALDEKVRFTDDQVDAFSKAFLGLTVSCARCHNHKFDAISQADYYAMFGILASTRPGRSVIDSPKKQNRNREQLVGLKDRIRQAIADDWTQSLKSFPATVAALAANEKPSPLLAPLQNDDSSKAADKLLSNAQQTQMELANHEAREFAYRWVFDGSQAADWFAFGSGVQTQPTSPGEFMIAADGDDALTAIFPAAIVSGALSTKHAARLESPQVNLDDEYELWLHVTGGGNAAYRYVVQNYPRNGTVFPVKNLTSEPGIWKWQKFDLSYWTGDDIHIELTAAKDAPLLTKGDARSWFGIREAVLVKKGEPAVRAPSLAAKPIAAALPQSGSSPSTSKEITHLYAATIAKAIERWRTKSATEEDAELLEACRRQGLLSSKLSSLPSAVPLIEEYRQLEQQIAVPTRVPTLGEWAGSDHPLFDRGNHKTPTETVPRRFLEVIDATPYEADLSGRLQLSQDVLRNDNPFTRRVIVNRVWHHLFGAGIVSTPDNFGRLGSEPTHPELLNYLAYRFAENDGWSLKSLIRLLVTSETWQRSSTPSTAATENDPGNQLLSHANIRRLEAEAIRDRLLQASGNLQSDLYGPPVSGGQSRRSVYVSVIRNRLDPFLATFDAPVPFGAKGRRDVTNVPAQSLMMLNDPFVVSTAKRLADSVQRNSALQSDSAKVVACWQRCLGRAPGDEELSASLHMIDQLKHEYAGSSKRRLEIQKAIGEQRKRIDGILSPVATRLEAALEEQGNSVVDLKPLAVWDFESDANDRVGKLDAKLHGSARLEDGAVVLDGKSWLQTPALSSDLNAKSLAVVVQVGDPGQRGGGVLTVQGMDGGLFDSIVYSERRPRHWMAGSNNFARTQDVGGTEETVAATHPVHIVITYQRDGTISVYRNGEPYGRPYKTGLQTFAKQRSEVIMGMRHGKTATGGRMFRGRLLDARLFDRALTPEEVRSAANGGKQYVTQKQIYAELQPWQSVAIAQHEIQISALTHELKQVGKPVAAGQEWTDLVHSLFNLKEFIYVR